MRRLLATTMLAAALVSCSGVDEPASRAVVDRFHSALNAGDRAAIDGLLSQSARRLRPGEGTARAFRAIIARHGKYQSGELAGISAQGGRTTIKWSARYENGPVSELFVLTDEGGKWKIDTYTDQLPP